MVKQRLLHLFWWEDLDLGWRGSVKDWLFFDVSGYWLRYNNRIGGIGQQRTINGVTDTINFQTNVGNSISRGTEILVEFSPLKAFSNRNRSGNILLYVSAALMNNSYETLRQIPRSTLKESNLRNNRIENAPEQIIRGGITYSNKK
jgi:Fe(3+) dicitrate transport protein